MSISTFTILQVCLHFLEHYKFQNSEPNDSHQFQIRKISVEKSNFSAAHHRDLPEILTPLWTRLEPDAKLQTPKPTKIRTQHKRKWMLYWVASKELENLKKWLNASGKTKLWSYSSESVVHHKKRYRKMCWMPDISTQTLSSHVNLGQRNI